MQRLHEDDLVGHLIRQQMEGSLLPRHRRSRRYPRSSRRYSVVASIVEKTGEALHHNGNPWRRSWKPSGRRSEPTTSPANTSSRLRPPAAAMVRVAWFARYDPELLDRKIRADHSELGYREQVPPSSRIIPVCKPLGGSGRSTSICSTYSASKLGYPDLKRAVREQHRLFRASTVLIEDKASGTQLIQELVEEGLSGVRAMKSEGDKIMRLHA